MNSAIEERIIGEQLSSVEFVQDYLQLHFDDKYLICYIWPVVIISEIEYRYKDPLYRDKLCELIGKIITAVHIKEKDYLIIEFLGYNSSLRININPDNPDIITEIAIFTDTSDRAWDLFN